MGPTSIRKWRYAAAVVAVVGVAVSACGLGSGSGSTKSAEPVHVTTAAAVRVEVEESKFTVAMPSAPEEGAAPEVEAMADRVTLDKTKNLSSHDLYAVAAAYTEMSALAAAGCGAPKGAAAVGAAALRAYAMRLTPMGVVAAGWAKALWSGFQKVTGQDFCDTALKAGYGAAWAAYYGSQGGTVSQIWVMQQDRSWAPDTCHVWQSFGPYWIVRDLTTSVLPGSGGCPR